MKKQQLLIILLLFNISITLFSQPPKTRYISGSSGETLTVGIQKKVDCLGLVKDRNRRPIEGAEIEFKNKETEKVEKQNTTNADGNYTVVLVLNKSYLVTVFKKGFGSKTIVVSSEDIKDAKLPDIILYEEYSNPPEVFIDPIEKDTIYHEDTILIKFQIGVKERNFEKAVVFQNDREIKTIINENPQSFNREEVKVGLKKGKNKITVVAYGKKSEFTDTTINVYYEPLDSKYYALLIAVENYQSKELAKLDFPISDAKKLQRILIDNYTFEEENMYFLKNPTKSKLEDKLDELKSIITDKDNLLIFYAGHGGYNKDKEVGYWLLADASPKRKQFLNGTLRDNIALIPSKHTLLISDACFSGSIFRSFPEQKEDSMEDFHRKMKSPSRKAMTSGNLEEVPDKSEFIRAIHYYLLSNTKQYTTSLKLFSLISDYVKNNDFQHGVIQDVGDEGGDFVFIKRQN